MNSSSIFFNCKKRKKMSRDGIKIFLILWKERERKGEYFFFAQRERFSFGLFGRKHVTPKRCTETFSAEGKSCSVATGFFALGELRHFPPGREKTKPFNRFSIVFPNIAKFKKRGTIYSFSSFRPLYILFVYRGVKVRVSLPLENRWRRRRRRRIIHFAPCQIR